MSNNKAAWAPVHQIRPHEHHMRHVRWQDQIARPSQAPHLATSSLMTYPPPTMYLG